MTKTNLIKNRLNVLLRDYNMRFVESTGKLEHIRTPSYFQPCDGQKFRDAFDACEHLLPSFKDDSRFYLRFKLITDFEYVKQHRAWYQDTFSVTSSKMDSLIQRYE